MNNATRREKIATVQRHLSTTDPDKNDFTVKVVSGRATFAINGIEAQCSDFWHQLWESLPYDAHPRTAIKWGEKIIHI
jgi:hypothetical protein